MKSSGQYVDRHVLGTKTFEFSTNYVFLVQKQNQWQWWGTIYKG
jgi:hypothetical protein